MATLTQNLLEQCRPGDIITLAAGQTCAGELLLKVDDVTIDGQNSSINGGEFGLVIEANDCTIKNLNIIGINVGFYIHRGNGNKIEASHVKVVPSTEQSYGFLINGDNNVIQKSLVEIGDSTIGHSAGVSVSGTKNEILNLKVVGGMIGIIVSGIRNIVKDVETAGICGGLFIPATGLSVGHSIINANFRHLPESNGRCSDHFGVLMNGTHHDLLNVTCSHKGFLCERKCTQIGKMLRAKSKKMPGPRTIATN